MNETINVEIREAMQAALSGDFGELDRIELAHLNRLVRIGELRVRHPDGELYWWHQEGGAIEQYDHAAPFVVGRNRGAGPGGVSVLEWRLLAKCRQCNGKLRNLACRACGGRWYVDDMEDHETVYTTLEGVLLVPEAL
jgi:hypothetical protein